MDAIAFQSVVEGNTVPEQYQIDNSSPVLVTITLMPEAGPLAADYQKEYGESINPRSIAADIAALKQEFHALISYDYQHRGYFYTDPAFLPAILPGDPEVLLSDLAPEVQPKPQFIPDWHKGISKNFSF